MSYRVPMRILPLVLAGTLSSLVALAIGGWFGQQYDGTILPLVYGFLSMGIAALLVSEGVERTKRRG